MPIVYKTGSIFDSKADALVNPVNCVGVMGAGLAAEFKRRFPYYFETYQDYCARDWIAIGAVTVQHAERTIINFPTKKHWKDPSKYMHIQLGLAHLMTMISDLDIRSIALPALGCGLGGLDWSQVKPMIEQVVGFAERDGLIHDVTFEIYQPKER